MNGTRMDGSRGSGDGIKGLYYKYWGVGWVREFIDEWEG